MRVPGLQQAGVRGPRLRRMAAVAQLDPQPALIGRDDAPTATLFAGLFDQHLSGLGVGRAPGQIDREPAVQQAGQSRRLRRIVLREGGLGEGRGGQVGHQVRSRAVSLRNLVPQAVQHGRIEREDPRVLLVGGGHPEPALLLDEVGIAHAQVAHRQVESVQKHFGLGPVDVAFALQAAGEPDHVARGVEGRRPPVLGVVEPEQVAAVRGAEWPAAGQGLPDRAATWLVSG